MAHLLGFWCAISIFWAGIPQGRGLVRTPGEGFESRTSLNFWGGFLFATAKVASITAMIFFTFKQFIHTLYSKPG